MRETYEFRIDGAPFQACVDTGHAHTSQGHANDPTLVVTTSLDTFIALLSQQLSPSEAVATGSVQLDGEQAALDRVVALFAWPSPATVLAG
jgi:putative sterol carrier protein